MSVQKEIVALIPSLRCYARALKRDIPAADDLVQECLCRALAKLYLWQKGTDLRAWLFTILHNQYVNDIRCLARQGASVAIEDVASTLTVAADALSLLQLRDLEHAIAGLPEVQRRAILLVGLEGMPYEDVAAMLGIPPGTLRSRLFRAREKLRELMDIDDAAKPLSSVPRPHMR